MLKPALRERLLGALVFLCLGLIFYPVVFDTRDEFVVNRETQVPTQLIRVAPMELEEPVISDPDVVVPIADEMFVPDEPTSVVDSALAETQGILNEEGVPNAWILQLGSFSEVANAEELEQRLLEAGYRAYIRRTESADGSPRHRVLVGPYLDRAIAQADSGSMADDGFGAPLLLDFTP